jgi:hypothetical protein
MKSHSKIKSYCDDVLERIPALLRLYRDNNVGTMRLNESRLTVNRWEPLDRTRIVYIYGLVLEGRIRYLGSSRQPEKRFKEMATGINSRTRSLVLQGASLWIIGLIQEKGSEPIQGLMIQLLKNLGQCDCNRTIPKTPRNRDVTWRGRINRLNDVPRKTGKNIFTKRKA